MSQCTVTHTGSRRSLGHNPEKKRVLVMLSLDLLGFSSLVRGLQEHGSESLSGRWRAMNHASKPSMDCKSFQIDCSLAIW